MNRDLIKREDVITALGNNETIRHFNAQYDGILRDIIDRIPAVKDPADMYFIKATLPLNAAQMQNLKNSIESQMANTGMVLLPYCCEMVKPVIVKGCWVPTKRRNIFGEEKECLECSECKMAHIPKMNTLIFEALPFCPNCGADMRKEGQP